MIYSTPEFILLFAATLGFYLLFAQKRIRFGILLAASLGFYAWAGVFDALIFAFVVAASWGAALMSGRDPSRRKGWIRVGILVMVLHLFFWKYSSWAAGQIQVLWPGFLYGRRLNLQLPVGISFFTLQGIAYLADLEAGRASLMPFGRYLLFKSFFAQLVAGPIVRSRQLLPQLESLRDPRLEDLAAGLSLFVVGFFKKVLIADKVSGFVDQIFAAPSGFTRTTLLIGIAVYAVQIWADFSGYTDMGRGCARMLGITLPENFISPYFACSPSEFWRRWHITLSQWIRDYIYIPLGGNRGSRSRAVAILIFTMTVSGLWHGANWTFALWGFYHGSLLFAERLLNRWEKPVLIRAFAWPATFAGVLFGWLLFRSPDIGTFARFLGVLAHGGTGTHDWSHNHGVIAALFVCAALHAVEYRDLATNERLLHLSVPKRQALAGAMAGIILALMLTGTIILRPFTGAPRAFIYFQF